MSYMNSSRTIHMGEETSTEKLYGILLVAVGLSLFLLYTLYQNALPKPINGIPYNPKSISGLLGDLPDLARTVANTGDVSGWLHGRAAEFNSPVCQIFIRPMSKPVVILSDFREAQDICMRRKEFDRGSTLRNLFKGSSPNHHITLLTGDEWKAHRRLLQDLMSPPFLQDVAAPAIYANVVNLINLWHDKTRIADGRPFNAYHDIFYTALDAVTAFSFGKDFPSNATKPVADLIRGLDETEIARLRDGLSIDDAIEFPTVECDEIIKATLDVSINIEKLHASPLPVWKWKIMEIFPPLNRTIRLKNQFIIKELKKAMARQEANGDDDKWMRSAVDLMVQREKKLAHEENRKPDFLSPTMKDELFGVITGGHDTTSTTLLWGLKLLADYPAVQSKLRSAMEKGFSAAHTEKRNPLIEEIMRINVPFLYASMEEILRCSGTAPLVEREAMCDTVLLGYHIPKGTKIFALGQGASIRSPAIQINEERRSETSRLAVKNRGRVPEWDPTDIALFNPDRWLISVESKGQMDEATGVGANVEFDSAAGPQIAFGLGKRSCFGKRLAYVELRILLSLIVWNFKILKCPDALSGYEGKDGVTHKPVKNWVRLEKVER
ncbi:cytochrome p450 monooxygenase [Colletotrichum truncatum]|uniref:Cytochrome p450 monooxygenase n=1 Tax=Colletotrichum truncatum TaxID=5467 RepID=A0ACC3ZKC1_COLTU|nr:cytochrome p450 monooxygenase [Colletotrichum truncatum]KAF6799959.1 cytochrome p450 monooxygenase [Colletotrichum truncatum]